MKTDDIGDIQYEEGRDRKLGLGGNARRGLNWQEMPQNGANEGKNRKAVHMVKEWACKLCGYKENGEHQICCESCRELRGWDYD